MICFRLDKELMGIAKEARCIYTRYADDITSSSHQPPTALFEVRPPAAGCFSPDLFARASARRLPTEWIRYQFRTKRTMPIATRGASSPGSRSTTSQCRPPLCPQYSRSPATQSRRSVMKAAEKNSARRAWRPLQPRRASQGKISFLPDIRGLSDPVVRSITVRSTAASPCARLR